MRLALPFALFLTAPLAVPALAQQPAVPVTARVDRLEKEMRAVQRKVFPGGAGMTVEAEIQPNVPVATSAGTPADSAISDLTSRVDALEKELGRLTGQVEQNGYRVRQMEDSLAKLQASTDGRLKALEGPPPEAAPVASPFGAPTPAPGKLGAKPDPAKIKPDLAKTEPKPKPSAATKPAADDEAATAAPSTGDPIEDAYMAGYRLWSDKKYPEAEASLKAFVAKYPKHKRASYAQNLLGRSLLDEGQPASAATEFYKNYKDNPRGERAPDSLYFLGQSLMTLKPPRAAEACKVYSELDSVYGASMAAPLKTRLTKARTDAKCS
jgi:TolA-binding protein